MKLEEPRKRIQFVYKTTNLLNNTYYIGVHSTWNIDDGYLGSGKRLGRAIKKYGKENFKREILATFDTYEEALAHESHLVNEDLLKDEMCLNLKPGGRGGLCNEEHRKKFHAAGGKKVLGICRIRHSNLLKTNTEYRERFGNSISKALKEKKPWLGRKHTEESKQKMSQSSKGKKIGPENSQFGTCWITNGIDSKRIKKAEEIPDGWKLGRIMKRIPGEEF